MPVRHSNAVWNGTLKEGSGTMSLGGGAWEGKYSFPSRFEDGTGTNPEELIAAAHAGCFSMALSAGLGKEGHNPKRVSTTAKVHLGPVEGGFGIMVDDVAAGDVNACLGVDYIVADKILSGAHIKFVVPKEMIVIPSPVAILKPTKNLPAAQKFVDFMLSKEAQTIIANNLTLPVRKDVAIKSEYGLIPVEDSVKRAIKVDYLKLKADKEAIIDRFNLIVRGK